MAGSRLVYLQAQQTGLKVRPTVCGYRTFPAVEPLSPQDSAILLGVCCCSRLCSTGVAAKRKHGVNNSTIKPEKNRVSTVWTSV